MKQVLRTMIAATLVATGLMSVSAPATAGTSCRSSQAGDVKRWLGTPTFHWTLRQHNTKENYSGSTRRFKFTARRGRSATDSIRGHAEVNAGLKVKIFAHLEGKVGLELGRLGQRTRFASFTEWRRLKSGDTYHYATGTGFWAARSTVRRCMKASMGGEVYEWHVIARGPVRGYLGHRDTLVGCHKRTHAGTMARYVKNRYCR